MWEGILVAKQAVKSRSESDAYAKSTSFFHIFLKSPTYNGANLVEGEIINGQR